MKNGFTLIELLLVIGLVAIVASMVIVAFNGKDLTELPQRNSQLFIEPVR